MTETRPHPGLKNEEPVNSLESLGVTDIMLRPQDSRNALLEGYGFRRHYADPFTVVWGLPLEMVCENL